MSTLNSHFGIERAIGHDFKNKALLIQALTHRSHTGSNNERLEFLGDGVLNFHKSVVNSAFAHDGNLTRDGAGLWRRWLGRRERFCAK